MTQESQNLPARRGRYGGGVKKGQVFTKTLEKQLARELVRQRITASLGPLLDAQIMHARGIGHVYTRDKRGKFSRVESQAEIERLITEGKQGEQYFIFSKDPSVQAFTDLMNRALDKPAEAIEVSGPDKGPLHIVVHVPWRSSE